jgi:hypothetical protein
MSASEKQRLRAIERAISSTGDYSVLRNGGEELVRRRATELGTTATALMHQWAGESKPPVPRNSPHPTPLPRREPDRDLSEDTADDDGDASDRECPACDGTGRAEDGDICDRCHGTGRVLQDDDALDDDVQDDDDQHADDSDDSDFD